MSIPPNLSKVLFVEEQSGLTSTPTSVIFTDPQHIEALSIKLVIFDMDGVLVETNELHRLAFTEALERFCPTSAPITKEHYYSVLEGLTSAKKLQLISAGWSKEAKEELARNQSKLLDLKQNLTENYVKKVVKRDDRMCEMMRALKEVEGYQVFVASNSNYNTVKLCLLAIGVMEYVDFFITAQEVKLPKPSAEIYMKCFTRSGFSPNQALIVEDSEPGRQSAIASGAHLMAVDKPSDVTLAAIRERIQEINVIQGGAPLTVPWQRKVNVIIPLTGFKDDFISSSYAYPQPLVEVNNQPLIQLSVKNLNIEGNFIFVMEKDLCEKYGMKYMLNLICPGSKCILTDKAAAGSLEAALLAAEDVDNTDPLLICKASMFLEWDSNTFMYSMTSKSIDGGLLHFTNTHPRHGYVLQDSHGWVTQVAYQDPISNRASANVYFWGKGRDFVHYGLSCLKEKPSADVLECYNHAIADGKKIKTFACPRMWELSNPADLTYFNQFYPMNG